MTEPLPLVEWVRSQGVRIGELAKAPPCLRCEDEPGVDPEVPFLICPCQEET